MIELDTPYPTRRELSLVARRPVYSQIVEYHELDDEMGYAPEASGTRDILVDLHESVTGRQPSTKQPKSREAFGQIAPVVDSMRLGARPHLTDDVAGAIRDGEYRGTQPSLLARAVLLDLGSRQLNAALMQAAQPHLAAQVNRMDRSSEHDRVAMEVTRDDQVIRDTVQTISTRERRVDPATAEHYQRLSDLFQRPLLRIAHELAVETGLTPTEWEEQIGKIAFIHSMMMDDASDGGPDDGSIQHRTREAMGMILEQPTIERYGERIEEGMDLHRTFYRCVQNDQDRAVLNGLQKAVRTSLIADRVTRGPLFDDIAMQQRYFEELAGLRSEQAMRTLLTSAEAGNPLALHILSTVTPDYDSPAHQVGKRTLGLFGGEQLDLHGMAERWLQDFGTITKEMPSDHTHERTMRALVTHAMLYREGIAALRDGRFAGPALTYTNRSYLNGVTAAVYNPSRHLPPGTLDALDYISQLDPTTRVIESSMHKNGIAAKLAEALRRSGDDIGPMLISAPHLHLVAAAQAHGSARTYMEGEEHGGYYSDATELRVAGAWGLLMNQAETFGPTSTQPNVFRDGITSDGSQLRFEDSEAKVAADLACDLASRLPEGLALDYMDDIIERVETASGRGEEAVMVYLRPEMTQIIRALASEESTDGMPRFSEQGRRKMDSQLLALLQKFDRKLFGIDPGDLVQSAVDRHDDRHPYARQAFEGMLEVVNCMSDVPIPAIGGQTLLGNTSVNLSSALDSWDPEPSLAQLGRVGDRPTAFANEVVKLNNPIFGPQHGYSRQRAALALARGLVERLAGVNEAASEHANAAARAAEIRDRLADAYGRDMQGSDAAAQRVARARVNGRLSEGAGTPGVDAAIASITAERLASLGGALRQIFGPFEDELGLSMRFSSTQSTFTWTQLDPRVVGEISTDVEERMPVISWVVSALKAVSQGHLPQRELEGYLLEIQQ